MFQMFPFTICDATFIGQDFSMGYRTGVTYRIRIDFYDSSLILHCGNHPPCPYDTKTAFFKNWKIWTGELQPAE